MPPSPRNRPSLEPALPRDSKPGLDHNWRTGNNDRWLMLFGNGPEDWRPVRARAWWTDDLGREVVDVEWFDSDPVTMGTWGGTFVVDRERMREG